MCKGNDIGGREHEKNNNKLVDRTAFIIDLAGNLSARDLKDEGFTRLCDSLA